MAPGGRRLALEGVAMVGDDGMIIGLAGDRLVIEPIEAEDLSHRRIDRGELEDLNQVLARERGSGGGAGRSIGEGGRAAARRTASRPAGDELDEQAVQFVQARARPGGSSTVSDPPIAVSSAAGMLAGLAQG